MTVIPEFRQRKAGGDAAAQPKRLNVVRVVIMLLRPPVFAVLSLFSALGLAAAGVIEQFHPLFTTVLIIVAGWFVNATALNDLADEDIDRVNLHHARGRPLVSGDATRRHVAEVGVVAGAISLVTAWFVDWRVGLIVVGGLLLNFAYSQLPLRLSGRGAIAPLVLPLGFVAVPFLVAVYSVRAALDARTVMLFAGLYVSFIGRIVLKDFRDVTGDDLFEKRTFLLRHGRVLTCALSAGFWVVGTVLLLASAPERSGLTVVVVPYVACALYGIYMLTRTEGYAAEQVTIGAVAHMGRATCVSLLAHFGMVAKDWDPSNMFRLHLLIAGAFLGMYVVLMSERTSITPEEVRTY